MRDVALRGREAVAPPDDPSAGQSAPMPMEAVDVLDWDVAVDDPPPRRAGTIRVTLSFAGRSRPAPVDDPTAE